MVDPAEELIPVSTSSAIIQPYSVPMTMWVSPPTHYYPTTSSSQTMIPVCSTPDLSPYFTQHPHPVVSYHGYNFGFGPPAPPSSSSIPVHQHQQASISCGQQQQYFNQSPSYATGWSVMQPSAASMEVWLKTSVQERKSLIQTSNVWRFLERWLVDASCPLAEWNPEQGQTMIRSAVGPGSLKDVVLIGLDPFLNNGSGNAGDEDAKRMDRSCWRIAMLLVVKEVLQLRGAISVYDPRLTRLERDLLQSLFDIQYIQRWEEGQGYAAVSKTLFWFNEDVIYGQQRVQSWMDAILQSNWGPWELAGMKVLAPRDLEVETKKDGCETFSEAIALFRTDHPAPAVFIHPDATLPDRIMQWMWRNMTIYEYPIAYLHQLSPQFWLQQNLSDCQLELDLFPSRIEVQAKQEAQVTKERMRKDTSVKRDTYRRRQR